MGGLRSVCQACGAELQTHRRAHTLSSPLMPLGVFDAGEASSADAGRLTLSQRIKGGVEKKAVAVLLFLAALPSESLHRCVQDKSR